MSLGLCDICLKRKVVIYSDPQRVCSICCSKLPIQTILQIMYADYHQDIEGRWPLQNIDTIPKIIDTRKAIFWCTADKDGLYQRCGTCIKWNFKKNSNFEETYILILTSYCDADKHGYDEFNHLKQNFKRILDGKHYRYCLNYEKWMS
jgi:hypothetical protein